MEAPTPRVRRVVKFVVYFVVGGVAAAAIARWFQPHYVDVCDRVTEQPEPCRAVPVQSMVGLFLIGLGIVSMTVVPIVTTITHVLRQGYDWETSRVETATANLPILAGLLYFAIGSAISLASYS